ncbi:MAG: rhamnan synthesis F family protein, partial [Bacteroidota bacterium]
LADKVLHCYHNREQLTKESETITTIVKKNFTTNVQSPKILEIIEQYYDKEECVLTEGPVVAVMTHIYYDDSWEEIKTKLKHFDNGINYFFFSISEACLIKEKIVRDIKDSFSNAYALITSNIGKDIGGKFVLIDLYLTLGIHPDYIIFLHDKKSPQTLVGESWKNNLYKIIDPSYYKSILKAFQNNSAGIVGAKEHIMNEYNRETRRFVHNNDISHRFLKKYGISIDNYEFLSGTMYWLKASIIEDFFSMYNPISFRKDLEAGNVLDNHDGTVAHTWERMFCWITTNYGYSIIGI